MRLLRILCVSGLLLLVGGQPAESAVIDSGKFDSMKRLSKVYDMVRRSYVREMTSDELMDGAIKGMLQGLDPHSTYLTKDEFKEMRESTTGEFFGIGIEMSSENNQLVVVSPIEDTPAYKAGIKAGDLILAVDGQPTLDMSTHEAVTKIRGPKGTPVELTILHRDAKTPVSITIIRDSIPLVSVKARPLDDEGYVWVRITRFSERTTEELEEALTNVAKKLDIKGIVLDLRNNPGGLLEQSVDIADLFLRSGTVVSIRGREVGTEKTFSAKSSRSDRDYPMVVLVNSGSASAAEIVAGALQDHNRGVLLGERTFGKGSVQHVIPLGDGTAIKLTIALYYTPNGSSIQAEGIVPDIELAFASPTKEGEEKPFRMRDTREKDLSRHLENTNSTAKRAETPLVKEAKEWIEKNSPEKPEAVAEDVQRMRAAGKLVTDDTITFYEKDNQLRTAYHLLKAMPAFSASVSR